MIAQGVGTIVGWSLFIKLMALLAQNLPHRAGWNTGWVRGVLTILPVSIELTWPVKSHIKLPIYHLAGSSSD